MNSALVMSLLGKVMLIDGVTFALPLVVSIIYGDGQTGAFLIAMAAVFACAAPLTRVRVKDDRLRPREGLAVVALCWVVLSLFGALPFRLGGWIPTYDAAFFETVSGYTTTGATTLTEIEHLPKSMLIWRSFTHWVGGMGVLILSLALIPKMGARSLHLMRAESPGPSPGKLVPKIGQSAKILYTLYLVLTAVLVGLLLIFGMNLYDALIHAFGTAGTGGFSNYNLSVGAFASPAIEIVISAFMLLFSVNFTLYFFAWTRNFKGILKNTELRAFLLTVLVSVIIVALNILPSYGGDVLSSLRHSFFQVSSIISTTGFVTQDFNNWPLLSKAILLFLMLWGACAGSTGGGLKMARMCILYKAFKRDLNHTMHPRGVSVVRMDGHAVDEDVISGVMLFFFAYIAVIVTAVLLVSVDNFSLETTFTAVLACISNIGPGLGDVGPVGNFAAFSPFSKIVLSMCMLIGRLDIYPILVLFTLSAWKRN